MKMRSCTLGDFIESLGRGEETPQNEKEMVKEHEKETEFDKAVDGLVDEIMRTFKEQKERTFRDFLKMREVREQEFKSYEPRYHESIEFEIHRPLTDEEVNLVDIAFRYAFMCGWVAHKKNGGNNGK